MILTYFIFSSNINFEVSYLVRKRAQFSVYERVTNSCWRNKDLRSHIKEDGIIKILAEQVKGVSMKYIEELVGLEKVSERKVTCEEW